MIGEWSRALVRVWVVFVSVSVCGELHGIGFRDVDRFGDTTLVVIHSINNRTLACAG